MPLRADHTWEGCRGWRAKLGQVGGGSCTGLLCSKGEGEKETARERLVSLPKWPKLGEELWAFPDV